MKWIIVVKDAIKKYIKKRMQPLMNPLANSHDDGKSRGPPPPPTPLEFPRGPTDKALGSPGHSAEEIAQLFLTIHKTGPTVEHLRSIGLCSVQEVSLGELLPNGYLPPTSWLQDPATTGGSDIFPAPIIPVKTLSNGILIPDHETYYRLAKELLYDNEDAFGAIQKKSSGQPLVRVATFRKFWDFLFQMSLYWDTGLDKYTDTRSEQDAMDLDQTPSANSTKKANVESKPTYTGRRIGTGRDMPPRFREDTVFTFVEAIAMAFRCRPERPRMETKIKLQNTLIPIPHTAIVYRSPNDRIQARAGFLEGPMTAIYCSALTSFRRPGEVEGEGQGEVTNLIREIGLMLSLAQKRAREGKKEPDPAEGKWWVTEPRWGGGPGGEFGTSEDRNEEYTEGSSKGRKRSKKSSAASSWKKLQPPPSTWDKGIIYKQIGKNVHSDNDIVSFPYLNPLSKRFFSFLGVFTY